MHPLPFRPIAGPSPRCRERRICSPAQHDLHRGRARHPEPANVNVNGPAASSASRMHPPASHGRSCPSHVHALATRVNVSVSCSVPHASCSVLPLHPRRPCILCRRQNQPSHPAFHIVRLPGPTRTYHTYLAFCPTTSTDNMEVPIHMHPDIRTHAHTRCVTTIHAHAMMQRPPTAYSNKTRPCPCP